MIRLRYSAEVKNFPGIVPILFVGFADNGFRARNGEGEVEEIAGMFAALSFDEGKTWKWKRYLEKGEGSYAYPSIIQTKDEKIHATYSYHIKTGRTIKHVMLDVDWIMEGDN